MSEYVEWRPVVGYEGVYEVSSQGQVRSLNRVVSRSGHDLHIRARTRKPKVNPTGHLYIELSISGTMKTAKVHRLVAEAFIPNPDNLPSVLHWDDNPQNNCVENLRWGTQGDNLRDAVRNGTHHGASKTKCKHGHEFNTENTYINPASGQRVCRACARIFKARWYRKSLQKEKEC